MSIQAAGNCGPTVFFVRYIFNESAEFKSGLLIAKSWNRFRSAGLWSAKEKLGKILQVSCLQVIRPEWYFAVSNPIILANGWGITD